MNNNNQLNIKIGSYGLVMPLDNTRVFIPTSAKVAKANGFGARVLSVKADGSISVHWRENYNTEGDFRTELMQFNSDLILDTEDEAARNKRRVANGLLPIE